jgi:hypothetical protein
MEENEYISNRGQECELAITPQSVNFLGETAKWAKFLAIVGIVWICLMVLFGLGVTIVAMAMPEMNNETLGGGVSLPLCYYAIIYVIIAAISFMPVYYLLKFSSNMKLALKSNNTQALTNAFQYLKSHYKFIGILTILGMAFYAIAIVVIIVAGVGMGLGSAMGSM